LVGIPATGLNVGFVTLQQTLTSDSHRGRAIGLFGAVFALGAMVGTLVAGVFAQTVGIVQMLFVQGTGYAVAGVILYFTVARHEAEIPTARDVEPLVEAGPGPQAGTPPAVAD
jgi:MFS family permease